MANKPKFYPLLPYQPRKRYGRSYGGSVTEPCKYRRYRWYESTAKANGFVTKTVIDDYDANMGDSTKTVVKLANWRQLISKGNDATNSYAREVRRIKPAKYSVTSENSTHTSIGFGSDNGSALESERDSSVLADQALGRLKHKLDGYVGGAQLAAPLAESREIHRLVRQVNGLTEEMLRAALAIKRTRGKSAAKFFGDVWLGFGFGVQPMIKDIASAANAILDFQTREDRLVRVVGTASMTYTSGLTTQPASTICPGVKVGYHDHAEHKLGVQIVAGIDLKMRSSASYGMSDHLGLSLANVPGAIWELTPFSWVVDYFTTVGDWVDDTFETLPGIVKYVSQSKKYQVDTTGRLFVSYNPGYKGTFASSPSIYQYVNFTRTKLATLPTRQLRFKTVDEVAKYGLTKILNLASVLAQKRF